MQIPFENKTLISKLRLKGFGIDSLAAKLNFEKMFAENDFLPKGLPAKAIICIKSLHDPKPQTLQLKGFNDKRAEFWRNSVANEIERLYRRAAHPIRETVSLNAECVVFADDSELLACLAKDWIRGNLTDCWWWKSLFPSLFLPAELVRIWLEKAESITFALQLLAKQNRSADFIRKLNPLEVKTVLQKIVSVYGLNHIQNTWQTLTFTEQNFKTPNKENPIKTQTVSADKFAKNKTPDKFPAWLAIVPETINQALNFDQKCLLGISLMIVRSPRIVRTQEFAKQIEIWQKSNTDKQIRLEKNAISVIKTNFGLESSDKFAQNFANQKNIKNDKNIINTQLNASKPEIKKPRINFEEAKDSNFQETPNVDLSSKLKTAKSTQKPKTSDRFTKPKTRFDKNTVSANAKVEKSEQNSANKILAKTDFENRFVEENELEFSIITLYGGIFFLLNVALHLNLYRDFTESGEAEIELNIWDFIALAAEYFLGERCQNDSVWQLFHKLSGRENVQMNSLIFKKDWRMPSDWLKTFKTNEPFLWTTNRKNLLIYHPAGFCVFDCLKESDIETQLKNELGFFGVTISDVLKTDSVEYKKPQTWFKRLCKFMQVRLIQALSLESKAQINEILFKRTAQITVSATHLDVYFRLADLPIEVRMSGVDRNPGWIPAAGKFVNFHFV
jgi:hypothetical protein